MAKLQTTISRFEKNFLDDTRSASSKVSLGMQVEEAIEYSYKKMKEIEKHKKNNCLTEVDIYTLEGLPKSFANMKRLQKENDKDVVRNINVTVSENCRALLEKEAKRLDLSLSDMACLYIIQYCNFFELEDVWS